MEARAMNIIIGLVVYVVVTGSIAGLLFPRGC